jgi:type II secretory pathway component PulF
MLAVATAAEAPFATVIEERLRHGQRRFRRRLGPVLNDLKAGARWTESLARWKIITTRRAALLAAAERAGNLTTALVDTAVVLERTAYRRIQRWSGAVAVVMIVMAAPVIVCLAADCLAPLADAIRIVGRAD